MQTDNDEVPELLLVDSKVIDKKLWAFCELQPCLHQFHAYKEYKSADDFFIDVEVQVKSIEPVKSIHLGFQIQSTISKSAA